MIYEVCSDRMQWPAGTVIGADALAGCNIVALTEGGHLRPVPELKTTKKRTPVVPVPNDTADEPEEQD
jgi:hypothetical protein